MRAFWRGLIERFVEATAEHLRREQATGRVRPELDADTTSEALVWGFERLWWVTVGSGRGSSGDLVDPLTRIWLGALYLEAA